MVHGHFCLQSVINGMVFAFLLLTAKKYGVVNDSQGHLLFRPIVSFCVAVGSAAAYIASIQLFRFVSKTSYVFLPKITKFHHSSGSCKVFSLSHSPDVHSADLNLHRQAKLQCFAQFDFLYAGEKFFFLFAESHFHLL